MERNRLVKGAGAQHPSGQWRGEIFLAVGNGSLPRVLGVLGEDIVQILTTWNQRKWKTGEETNGEGTPRVGSRLKLKVLQKGVRVLCGDGREETYEIMNGEGKK